MGAVFKRAAFTQYSGFMLVFSRYLWSYNVTECPIINWYEFGA